jgi:hypothetical protein
MKEKLISIFVLVLVTLPVLQFYLASNPANQLHHNHQLINATNRLR